MRAAQWLRGSPTRRALAGFAAAITVVTSFFVVQGLAGADVVTAPPTKMLAVGPTSPDNGFPVWYKDSNNLSVGLCLDDANPFCNITAADVPDVTQPISFPDNFPDETFYQLAQSTITLPGGGTAVLNDNLEAAFNTPTPQANQQITFGRVRIRLTTPSTGHYVITHPYGVDAFDVTDTTTRNINFTEDIGIGAQGDFKGALGSRVNPFLRWDTGLIKGPDGASYLGDAVTAHAITGSDLNTNFFRIDGPDIGGPGVNTIQTNLFTLQGRVATNAGVSPTQVTYTRSTTSGGFVDAFATSQADQVIQVSGAGISTTKLKADASGNYFGRVAFTGATPPTSVQVTNVSDRPPTTVNVTLTDQVLVTKAAYNSDTGTLVVNATSSDTATPPTLTAQGFGALTSGAATFALGADQLPPGVITVTSSKSGSGSAPVVVSGAALPADPVTAQAPATLTVQQGQQVQLDGSASLNATGFSWAQVAGTPTVTLSNANTSIASFTAPATATTLTFRLTVQGPGGPKTTDEVVTVAAIAPPRANAGPPQSVLAGSVVNLDGSGSTGATSYLWKQTGGVAATLSSTTAVKPTFTMPNTADPVIFQLTVTGPGGTDVATVQISPIADVLTTSQVEFRQSKSEWRIQGTATVVTGNTIKIHLGNDLTGPLLNGPTGSSVDALGAWSFRIGSGPQPPASRTISIESARGGVLLAIPIVVRN
jgi:K319-like protein